MYREEEMLLPIKKKWFDMILSGEKKEEYREIKPYYTKRLQNIFGVNAEQWEKMCKSMEFPFPFTVTFRNGYSSASPSFDAEVSLKVGYGREEWGASPGIKYYVLKIEKIRQLSTT